MLHAVKVGWLPPLNEMNKTETYEPKCKTAKELWEVWEDKEGKWGVTLYCLYWYGWIGAEGLAEILILV